MDPLNPFAERVLDLVERIPPGKVMAYGDIAEYLGEGGPRQVGKVMSTWGGGVPWWRVVHADGSGAAPDHVQRCLTHWREEGTPLRAGSGERVDMRLARWDGRSTEHEGRSADFQ
jgi:alkylated DNA nucleotide flippase Atl1